MSNKDAWTQLGKQAALMMKRAQDISQESLASFQRAISRAEHPATGAPQVTNRTGQVWTQTPARFDTPNRSWPFSTYQGVRAKSGHEMHRRRLLPPEYNNRRNFLWVAGDRDVSDQTIGSQFLTYARRNPDITVRDAINTYVGNDRQNNHRAFVSDEFGRSSLTNRLLDVLSPAWTNQVRRR